MLVPNRHGSNDNYRYGFNNMEKDDEIKGEGNSIDFGSRMYDPRVIRWFAPDPMESKYPSLTTYHFTANNPIIYYDFDGEDIVYFNRDGKEVYRVASEEINETWVMHKNADNHVVDKMHMQNRVGWVKAEMPNRIIHQGAVEKGRDLNRYDYQIAASTYLMNQSIEDGTAYGKKGSEKLAGVPILSPDVVKAMVIKESQVGYIKSKFQASDKDVMQVNVGSSSKTATGDWSSKKVHVGLTENVVPTPEESIHAGVKWLYYKGTTYILKYSKDGRSIAVDKYIWDGGTDWFDAVKKYNQNNSKGDDYLKAVKEILNNLEKGQTNDYAKEQKKKKEKEKKKNDKG